MFLSPNNTSILQSIPQTVVLTVALVGSWLGQKNATLIISVRKNHRFAAECSPERVCVCVTAYTLIPIIIGVANIIVSPWLHVRAK